MTRLRCLVPVFALLLGTGAPSADAAATTVDSFETTLYTTTTGAGESVVLSGGAAGTEGTASLRATWSYTAAPAWTHEARVEKSYATPLDLRSMTHFSVDVQVPVAHTGLILIVSLVDEKGAQARFVDSAAFEAATTGFRTLTWDLGRLEKTQWAGQGRAVNLGRISQIWYRIQNRSNLPASGSFEFSLDHARAELSPDRLREVVLDDFEAYPGTPEASAAWVPMTGGTQVAVDTAAPYAGSRSLQLQTTITGRWLNYWAERTLPAPVDLTDAIYMKLAVRGDAKLASLMPTAHLFLVDGNGNRAVAYIWDWPASDGWSEIHLPFRSDGVEPWAGESTLAYGGNSCWREDKWDAGWNTNCDLSNITKLWLAIETQNTGTYPVAGVSIGFDNLVYGYEPAADTPSALSAALATAAPGAVLSLGYPSGSFNSRFFLNRAPDMMASVPGTLVYSDDPESAAGYGVLFRDRLAAGLSRIYLYHVSENSSAAKVSAVLQNAGTETAHVTFSRKALPSPSTNYLHIGMQGVRQFYENTVLPPPLTIPPGQAALVDPAMDSVRVTRNQLFHSIHDFTSDQPVTFTALLLPEGTNTLSTFSTEPFLPNDGHDREGTFTALGKGNSTPYSYDTADGIQPIRIADWGEKIDPFLEGWNPEQNKPSRLLGNYGVTYRVRVDVSSQDGRKLAVMLVPPEGSCGYAGYVRWRFPETGAVTGQLVPPSTGEIAPAQGGLVAKITPTATPQILELETIPAGATCLPIDIHLIPFSQPSGVEDSELY